jgi:hypothetical protein
MVHEAFCFDQPVNFSGNFDVIPCSIGSAHFPPGNLWTRCLARNIVS